MKKANTLTVTNKNNETRPVTLKGDGGGTTLTSK